MEQLKSLVLVILISFIVGTSDAQYFEHQTQFDFFLASNDSGGVQSDQEIKIVGGEVISIAEAPYQASLQYSGIFICGASIISTKFCLSAAHCTHDVSTQLSVRVGSNYTEKDGEVIPVEKAINHPSFNSFTLNFDFALLQLARSIVLTPGLKEIVSLASANDNTETGAEVFVTGFGATAANKKSDNLLRGVVVPVVAQNICRRSYPLMLTGNMICAGLPKGGKDSCSGDSGGPMVRRKDKVLVGVVSFGRGCAQPKFYGVYARVSSVRAWIKQESGV